MSWMISVSTSWSAFMCCCMQQLLVNAVGHAPGLLKSAELLGVLQMTLHLPQTDSLAC